MLTVEYRSLIDPDGLNEDETSVFVNLEYPPIVLTDIRKLISDLTAETGLVRVVIDPWDFVRQTLSQIANDAEPENKYAN